ncbi:MFS transporter [Actinomadura barringtoniae]|uniref:MFS transporter n=1 Tax=Actinomadura barringtoniae TaxID=1427535 RepID=A0A939PFS6_9ACTN|nr:MFS transporter [Actinomadura barringtoniae]MBO2451841.1 MFS transporter [Actinomadura barringtoniae]
MLLSALFMAQYDFFVVNVAAPSIGHDLHAGPVALELVVGGYGFAYAAGMITGGRLGDLFGHRRIFVVGMAAFTTASLLCGMAPTPGTLVAARLLQGLTGALMVPQVLAVVTAAFPEEGRARALGWYGVAAGLGSIAGQVLGGLLLQADVFGLGWRVIFLVNLPVGVPAAILAWRLLPRTGGDAAKLDPLGAAGVALALGLLLAPLTLGQQEGWPVWTWISMASAIPMAALTLWWQRTLTARGGRPVLDLSLFRVPSYVAGVVAIAAFMAYFVGFMFTLALLLQAGLGLTAFQAGLAFAPMGVLYSATSLGGSKLAARHGTLVPLAGCALSGAGLIVLAARLLTASADPGLPCVMTGMVLVGAGNGLILPQLIRLALTRVNAERAGVGSAVLTTAQQFAGAAGVAVSGAVFFAVLDTGSTATAHGRAMGWVSVLFLVLVALTTALVAFNARLAARIADLGQSGGGR